MVFITRRKLAKPDLSFKKFEIFCQEPKDFSIPKTLWPPGQSRKRGSLSCPRAMGGGGMNVIMNFVSNFRPNRLTLSEIELIRINKLIRSVHGFVSYFFIIDEKQLKCVFILALDPSSQLCFGLQCQVTTPYFGSSLKPSLLSKNACKKAPWCMMMKSMQNRPYIDESTKHKSPQMKSPKYPKHSFWSPKRSFRSQKWSYFLKTGHTYLPNQRKRPNERSHPFFMKIKILFALLYKSKLFEES